MKLVHEGKFSAAPRRDLNLPTEADGRDDGKNRTKTDNGACRQGAKSQPEVKAANKGTSKLLTADCIQNWSETIIVEKNRQDFRSETLLVDAKQVVKEEMVLSEHSIMQTEENLNYTITEERKYRSLILATSKETSEELSVQVELLPEKAEVCTVLQHVQQGKLFRGTSFHARNLLLEEGNKCFELDKSNGFVHEQQFALQDDWDETAMFRKLCYSAMNHDKPVKDNTKSETQAMNATVGKRFDLEFKVSLVEETIVNDCNISNHWTGNGNSGMDVVAQANGIHETQLSKGLHKRPKKKLGG